MCTGKAFPLSGKHRVPTLASNPFKVQKWQVICLATEKRIHVLPELHTMRSMFSQRHLYLLIKCQGWEDEDREIQSEKSNSENTYTALSVGIPSHLKYHCLRHTEFACYVLSKSIEIRKRRCMSKDQSDEGDKWKVWILGVLKTSHQI